MGKGPLDGLKVIELAGIGPAPFCATSQQPGPCPAN